MSRKWLSITVLLPLLAVLCSVRAQNVAPPEVQPAPVVETPIEATPTPLRPQPVSAPRVPAVSRQTLVIHLENLRSDGAVEMLNQLLVGETTLNVNMATDTASNTIILRGAKEHVEEIVTLLKQLDNDSERPRPVAVPMPPRYPSGTQRAQLAAPAKVARQAFTTSAAPAVAYRTAQAQYGLDARLVQRSELETKLVQEFSKLEEQTLQTAREYRSDAKAEAGIPGNSSGADGSTPGKPRIIRLSEQRKRLAELVQQAFDKRQEVQEQEVKQLKERLQKIEGTLSKRTEHRQEIIDKRVSELLDEDRDLGWDAAAMRTPVYAAQALTVAEQASDPNATAPFRSMYGSNVANIPSYGPPVTTLQPVAIPGPPGGVEFRSVLPGPRAGETGVISATSSHLSATNMNLIRVESELLQAELELKQSQGQLENKATTQIQHEIVAARVKQAKAQRDFVRRELETQLRLLELEVAAAQARVETLKTGGKNGTIAQNEVLKLKGETEQAEYQLQKAKALYDLHRNSLPTESGTSESQPTKPK